MNLTRISRYLFLQYKPDSARLTLDTHGYAKVGELICAVREKYPLDEEILRQIVAVDDKQRYSYSPDGTRIRCNQGRAISVDVGPEEV